MRVDNPRAAPPGFLSVPRSEGHRPPNSTPARPPWPALEGLGLPRLWLGRGLGTAQQLGVSLGAGVAITLLAGPPALAQTVGAPVEADEPATRIERLDAQTELIDAETRRIEAETRRVEAENARQEAELGGALEDAAEARTESDALRQRAASVVDDRLSEIYGERYDALIGVSAEYFDQGDLGRALDLSVRYLGQRVGVQAAGGFTEDAAGTSTVTVGVDVVVGLGEANDARAADREAMDRLTQALESILDAYANNLRFQDGGDARLYQSLQGRVALAAMLALDESGSARPGGVAPPEMRSRVARAVDAAQFGMIPPDGVTPLTGAEIVARFGESE